jgi:FlaG/FlaF family flagellin (archaellin)
VITLDRRKLVAPLFAQAAAFVAVLVIGGFTGHSSPKAAPSSGSGQTAGPTATATATASAASSKGAALKLTVRVIKDGEGLPLPGSQVTVLQDGTLASVMTGTLNSALEFAANVPAGQYQVCINPPIGWDSRIRSTQALAGWICSPADLRTSPQLVTFRLTSPVSP